MKRPAYAPWTNTDLAKLRALYPHYPTTDVADQLGREARAVYAKANSMAIKKTAEFLASGKAGRLDGIRGGATRFKSGQISWNKGLTYQPGGRCVETQFKKGVRQGVAVKLYQPLGTERISKDGYLQRKINDDLPPQKRWRGVHIVIWEEVNGPLPSGHALVFKDKNKKNITLDNLELVTRAELMRRNSVHTILPKEIAQLVQLRGALNRKINNRKKATDEQRDAN